MLFASVCHELICVCLVFLATTQSRASAMVNTKLVNIDDSQQSTNCDKCSAAIAVSRNLALILFTSLTYSSLIGPTISYRV